MPIVRIDIQAGKSTAYKRQILQSVRAALIRSLGVADARISQRIIETPAENIDASNERSDRLTIIEIAMLPGRDAALKQAMYAEIVSALAERPGIHQHDITVLVNDPSAECFAIGGVMQCTISGDPLPPPERLFEDEPAEPVREVDEIEPAEMLEPQAEPAAVPQPAEPLAAEPTAGTEPAEVVEWPSNLTPEA